MMLLVCGVVVVFAACFSAVGCVGAVAVLAACYPAPAGSYPSHASRFPAPAACFLVPAASYPAPATRFPARFRPIHPRPNRAHSLLSWKTCLHLFHCHHRVALILGHSRWIVCRRSLTKTSCWQYLCEACGCWMLFGCWANAPSDHPKEFSCTAHASCWGVHLLWLLLLTA